MRIILLVCVYIICFIISYGLCFASLQNDFPLLKEEDYKKDLVFSIIISLFGPISIFAVIMECLSEKRSIFKYGLKFW